MIGVDKLQKIVKACLVCVITGLLVLSLNSCGDRAVGSDNGNGSFTGANRSTQSSKAGNISEASPPSAILELRQALETYQPQVKILSPQANEVFQSETVTARFQVQDLPIFKNPELDNGLHLDVILDNQPSIAVYDLNQPLVFPDLLPGTHTLRVFASRPWHESFKNEGAYAQTTFHIFTKTDDNNPDPTQPLLTYNSPQGTYGAEPILLDFYLTNAPLHLVAQENPQDEIADWRIRCTINGNSFVIDRWESIYLKGFKPGKNWVQLEFLDEQGNPVKNVFNNTVRVITYEPNSKDTLSKLIRGELSADAARGIVDPNYTGIVEPIEPTPAVPKPLPAETPTPQPSEEPVETEIEPDSEQTTTEEPKPTQNEQPQGLFNRFRRSESKPTPIPDVNESPEPKSISPDTNPPIEEPQPGVTPVEPAPLAKPDSQELIPTKETEDNFNRLDDGSNAEPTPIPEVISPQPQSNPDSNFPAIEEPQPLNTPAEPNTLAKPESKYFKLPPKERLGGYFSRLRRPQVSPSPDLPPTLPEIVEPYDAAKLEELGKQ